MLKLRIDTADLAGRWSYRESAWVNGGSRITPFAHPSIETLKITLPGWQLIVVRENPAQHVAAEPIVVRLTPGDHDAAIAALTAWPLSIVIVSIPESGPEAIKVHSGMFVTAPLFVAQAGRRLIADWDAADLYPYLPLAIDAGRTAFQLCHFGLPYSRRTIFRDVLQLTERSTATWHPQTNKLTVRYPPPMRRAMPRRLKDKADIVGAFETLLGAVVRRSANGSVIASELSGGLDSGVATMVAARALGPDRVLSFGLLLPGSQKISQQARRAELAEQAGVADTIIDADDLGPFSRHELDDADPAIPWGEYYREAFLAVGEAIAATGCNIVIRGIGGDEISELTRGEIVENEIRRAPLRDHFPPYLTENARRSYAAMDKLDPAPAGHAAISFYQGLAASAPCYLRRGIWPIYPYGAPEVIDFCRSLPLEWREDRTLQRALLRAAGLSAEVARPDKPESFLPLRDLMFRGPAAAHVRDIFRKPLLAELGLVDATCLQETFERAARDPASPERAHLLEAVSVETVLRTWHRASTPMGP